MENDNYKRPTETHSTDYKETSGKLWDLLDDIDTASDIFKPSEANGFDSFKKFYTYVMNKSEERHKYMKSDGYDLYSLEEFDKLTRDDNGNLIAKQFEGASPLMKRNC